MDGRVTLGCAPGAFITDEVHRSQYDIFASNMRSALPNAAFTGTPLTAGEERTKEVFGEYVSVYHFKEPVDDENKVLYDNSGDEYRRML